MLSGEGNSIRIILLDLIICYELFSLSMAPESRRWICLVQIPKHMDKLSEKHSYAKRVINVKCIFQARWREGRVNLYLCPLRKILEG